MKLRVKKLSNFIGDFPRYETPGSSGFDVRAQLNGQEMTIQAGERVLVPTGLSFEIPSGYELQARPRSGLAAKKGITLLNTPGTIDSDYRGEVKIILVNLGKESVTISDQERIAQIVVCPVLQAQFEIVSDLTSSLRGEGGFGSTGSH